MSDAKRRAFTLIETMLAVLLLAVLAGAAALNLLGPLRAAAAQDAADQLASFDAAARQAAVGAGVAVRLQFDLADNSLARFEGDDANRPRARAVLPGGIRIERVRVVGNVTTAGVARVDLSAHGWGPSYTVHLQGPAMDRWFCVAGLTGEISEAADEASLPPVPHTPGYDAD